MKRAVAVVGPAECTQEQAGLAEQVGRLLAEQGAVVVCGGRGGVMEAACKGAIEAKGITVGLLPGVDAAGGNAYLSIALPTGLGQARNALVVNAGQSVIAIGGAQGTLSEIALASKAKKRVIGLGTWSAVDHAQHPLKIEEANSAEEAVELALQDG